jgi:hypothetical protein
MIVACAAGLGQTTRPGAATRPDGHPLIDAPVEVRSRVELPIEGSADPRMLVVRGRRKDGGNAAFEVGGETWGTAAAFPRGAGLFEAAMPLAGSRPPRKLAFGVRSLAPPPVFLDEVRVVPAARVRFVIRDQGTKAPVPGCATVETIGGEPPPAAGPLGGFPREQAGWISHDGHGDLYVPPGASVSFVGRSTPFRGVNRQKHVIEARDNMLVTFLLSSDQLPEGAAILEGPPRPSVPPEIQKAVDRARGIGKRPTGYTVVPAKEILAQGAVAVEQALLQPGLRFLATNETGPLLFPPTSLVTVELPGGDLLHSNGPVILVTELRREGTAVRGFIKVRLPEGVIADRLVIRAGAAKTEHVLNGPTTVPLDVIVPPRTPIGLIAAGPPRPDAPLDRVAAFRVFLAP